MPRRVGIGWGRDGPAGGRGILAGPYVVAHANSVTGVELEILDHVEFLELLEILDSVRQAWRVGQVAGA